MQERLNWLDWKNRHEDLQVFLDLPYVVIMAQLGRDDCVRLPSFAHESNRLARVERRISHTNAWDRHSYSNQIVVIKVEELLARIHHSIFASPIPAFQS